MIRKYPLCPERIRKVPRQFSWLDHRLVRDGYFEKCNHSALALYLFLVTVGDAKGLSYYSDASIEKRLSMDHSTLKMARQNLINVGMIAYRAPLYQVLCINTIEPIKFASSHRGGEPCSIKEIFKNMVKE